MRFNIVLSVPLIATFVTGLAIPNLEVRGLKEVADAHRHTIGLPGRHDLFHVAAGGGKPAHVYSGLEVRKAVYDSHHEADRLQGLNKKQQKQLSHHKDFKNYPHRVPKAGGDRPLPHATTVNTQNIGREYPLPNHHGTGPSPARIITQQMPGGHHQLHGVIAHDQSRPGTHAGYGDHFHVPAQHHGINDIGTAEFWADVDSEHHHH